MANIQTQNLSTRKLILAAAAALLAGVLVYLADRQGDAWFVAALPSMPAWPTLFGDLGRHLPSALHVFAFALLTAVCLPRGRRYDLAACCSWLCIDSLFELGQHPLLQYRIAAQVPDWFDRVPLLDVGRAYFINGRFDPLDLAAVALGAAAAWLALRFSDRNLDEISPGRHGRNIT